MQRFGQGTYYCQYYTFALSFRAMTPSKNFDVNSGYSQEWLAATFTKQIFGRRQTVEPPKFRSIVQAVRASMYVDKITRKTSQAPVDVSPASQMLQVYFQTLSYSTCFSLLCVLLFSGYLANISLVLLVDSCKST